MKVFQHMVTKKVKLTCLTVTDGMHACRVPAKKNSRIKSKSRVKKTNKQPLHHSFDKPPGGLESAWLIWIRKSGRISTGTRISETRTWLDLLSPFASSVHALLLFSHLFFSFSSNFFFMCPWAECEWSLKRGGAGGVPEAWSGRSGGAKLCRWEWNLSAWRVTDSEIYVIYYTSKN